MPKKDKHANNQPVLNNDQHPRGFVCPINQDIYTDPVMAKDGQSYERNAIQQWFALGHMTSPSTGAALADRTLTPNIQLRQACEEYRNHLDQNRNRQGNIGFFGQEYKQENQPVIVQRPNKYSCKSSC